jgi:hypothetical protein
MTTSVGKFSDILRTVSNLVLELAALYDATHIPQEGLNPSVPAVEFTGSVTINGPVAGQGVNDNSLRESKMLAQQLRLGGEFDEA